MIVTKIEPVTSTKYKVEIDGEFAFVLYKGELKRFHLCEGREVEETVFQTIKKDVVLKRAKLRAMHLLTDMDRTKSGLEEKLKRNLYPADVIEQAIAYVDSFGYLNDERYAENFVIRHKKQKSRKEIYALLNAKGISSDEAKRAMEKYGDEEEKEAVRILVEKKIKNRTDIPEQELQKIYAYLARKGFRYEIIRQVVQNYSQNT